MKEEKKVMRYDKGNEEISLRSFILHTT